MIKRKELIEKYNKTARDAERDTDFEWDNSFQYPIMEEAPGNKIRWSYEEFLGGADGIGEIHAYINLKQGLIKLKELEKEIKELTE